VQIEAASAAGDTLVGHGVADRPLGAVIIGQAGGDRLTEAEAIAKAVVPTVAVAPTDAAPARRIAGEAPGAGGVCAAAADAARVFVKAHRAAAHASAHAGPHLAGIDVTLGAAGVIGTDAAVQRSIVAMSRGTAGVAAASAASLSVIPLCIEGTAGVAGAHASLRRRVEAIALTAAGGVCADAAANGARVSSITSPIETAVRAAVASPIETRRKNKSALAAVSPLADADTFLLGIRGISRRAAAVAGADALASEALMSAWTDLIGGADTVEAAITDVGPAIGFRALLDEVGA